MIRNQNLFNQGLELHGNINLYRAICLLVAVLQPSLVQIIKLTDPSMVDPWIGKYIFSVIAVILTILSYINKYMKNRMVVWVQGLLAITSLYIVYLNYLSSLAPIYCITLPIVVCCVSLLLNNINYVLIYEIIINVLAIAAAFLVKSPHTNRIYYLSFLIGISVFLYLYLRHMVKQQKKLAESQSKMKAIISAMPDMVFVLDDKGVVMECSLPKEYPTQKSMEMIGKKVYEIITEQVPANILNIIKEVLTTGKTRFLEYSHNVNGETRCFEANFAAIDNCQVVSIVRDITSHKSMEQKLKKNEAKYRSLFENMHNCFAHHRIIVNEDNKPVDYEFLEVNRAFEEYTGIKSEEIYGKKCLS
ncbi:PAS domain-containing protein [Pseudobacteroides cellulosolvens]|uniref:PAS sensor protein n=1 Tax=Pseudobacteroides cellulosolvens ATCC 35603 = DSM 2933 TaxID=398512 RepID=A0A0L6JKP5_9FIRM|nr:PAS domain S-box protein [Pseudobacteroides cellulosolvens]KNY26283.1 PAS sensor protein [Pseudobacteroides cellulosolvens ATCC 35603 = DSM 2933]